MGGGLYESSHLAVVELEGGGGGLQAAALALQHRLDDFPGHARVLQAQQHQLLVQRQLLHVAAGPADASDESRIIGSTVSSLAIAGTGVGCHMLARRRL